jgi:SIR2-like domain
MMVKWESIRDQIEALAKSNQLLPFLGAAVSYFQPTNLPLGSGLLHAALQGIFPSRNLFVLDKSNWTPEEIAIANHSPEVILQGLAEGLLDRGKLASLYNAMRGIPHNPLHHTLATALLGGKVPAIFTTNQDHCIEDAAGGPLPIIYDKQDFTLGLRQGLFQFHGAIGGTLPEESAKRKQSLTFALHGMGPHLTTEHRVLSEAISKYTLLFLGYSGSDPDIWYSLSGILQAMPQARIYWCVRDKPSQHLLRLQSLHRNSIVLLQGDILEVLRSLSVAWDVGDPGPIREPDQVMQEERRQTIRAWATDLTNDERDLAYGWLLVSTGQHRRACEELEALLARSKANRQIHMLAALFAGYARREMSDHIAARRHLRMALEESEGCDQCRYAQAAHKLGESLSTFESVRFWYFWPHVPQIHSGAQWLLEAIKQYQGLSTRGSCREATWARRLW